MDVYIKPNYKHFFAEYTGLTLLFMMSLVVMPFSFIFNNGYIQIGLSSLSLLLAIVGIAKYITLTAVVWIISDTSLCRIRGVFSRHTDYIELYRVVDYSESQTFLQKLWRVKTVCIISTDKTDSTMVMYGVYARYDIVQLIRNRVENCKKEKRIYEITNQ